jgi:hypothetical protein
MTLTVAAAEQAVRNAREDVRIHEEWAARHTDDMPAHTIAVLRARWAALLVIALRNLDEAHGIRRAA